MTGYLSQIKESAQIEGAFLYWEGYRERLTEYIMGHTQEEDSSIVIFGAGACRDLDLARISEEFIRITLVDKEEKDMEKACKDYPISDGAKVACIPCNFWPVSDEEYEKFERLLQKQAPIQQAVAYLDSLTEEKIEKPLELPIKQHQIGVCMGVHSQLNTLFAALFYMYAPYYTREDRTYMMQAISRMNESAVKWFDDAILRKVDQLFLGYEYGAFLKERDGGFGKLDLVKACFDAGEAKEVIKYKISRVEGAYQAETDFSRRYHQKEIVIRNWNTMIWPFLPEKRYLMEILVVENMR